MGFDIDDFLEQPLTARVATQGPTVRPTWFLWEDGAFWILTGPWARLHDHVLRDPHVDSSPPSAPLLAYVFWHWPPASAAVPTYEADLLSFHSSLESRPPAGFVRSATFRVSGASWLPRRECYEDWYLVRGWAAVGELNREAVASAHAASHDRVASAAESGAGGLYALRAGDDVPGGGAATWFAKPPGWSYAELDTALEAGLGDGLALWQRQLALGPAPEFCLRGNAVPVLVAPLHGAQATCQALR